MIEYYKLFSNKKCEYFPCHKINDNTIFNCLFCYCPLYRSDIECGGNFVYLENGVKSCTDCFIPHSKNGYDYIHQKLIKAYSKEN